MKETHYLPKDVVLNVQDNQIVLPRWHASDTNVWILVLEHAASMPSARWLLTTLSVIVERVSPETRSLGVRKLKSTLDPHRIHVILPLVEKTRNVLCWMEVQSANVWVITLVTPWARASRNVFSVQTVLMTRSVSTWNAKTHVLILVEQMLIAKSSRITTSYVPAQQDIRGTHLNIAHLHVSRYAKPFYVWKALNLFKLYLQIQYIECIF